VWKKVRPAQKKKGKSPSTTTAVAGLRGSEKGKYLKPRWKGDKKSESPDMAAFREAAALMDNSQFAKAEKLLLTIIKNYPKSTLLPRVKIALAICYMKQGKKNEALKVLDQWLKDYPKNELADDVKALIAQIKK